MLLEHFPVSLGVVLGIVIAVSSAYTLTMPIDHAMLARPMHAHHSVAQVRHVFREYGVRLHYTSHPSAAVTVLGVIPPPYADTALYVSVTRAGAVSAHYGGRNDRVRRAVSAAVAALSR